MSSSSPEHRAAVPLRDLPDPEEKISKSSFPQDPEEQEERSPRARHERHAKPLWSPDAGPYYAKVHGRVERLLAGTGRKALPLQLLDVRCYAVEHVARVLSDLELKRASGVAIRNAAALFWTQLQYGGLRPESLWHPNATANLDEHAGELARIANPEPAPRRSSVAPTHVAESLQAMEARRRNEDRLRQERYAKDLEKLSRDAEASRAKKQEAESEAVRKYRELVGAARASPETEAARLERQKRQDGFRARMGLLPPPSENKPPAPGGPTT